MSVLTFALFRYDKGQAQRKGARRVPETTLLLLVMAGGMRGALGGLLWRPRHKTRKPLFWVVLLLATALYSYLFLNWIRL